MGNSLIAPTGAGLIGWVWLTFWLQLWFCSRCTLSFLLSLLLFCLTTAFALSCFPGPTARTARRRHQAIGSPSCEVPHHFCALSLNHPRDGIGNSLYPMLQIIPLSLTTQGI